MPDTGIDFDISGVNFAGFRFGVQWRALEYLQVGVSYRHKTETTVDGDGIVIGSQWDYVGTKLTLPSRLAFGLRSDFADFGVALDLEYAFNSQNDQAGVFIGADEESASPLANVFDWDNALTIRAGVEYRLLDGRLPVRAGYIWDQTTSSAIYSSAFGTPPGPTHVITLGTGWNTQTWSIDVAYAFRQGSASVTQADFDQRGARMGDCQFSAYPTDPGPDGTHGTNDDGSDYEIKLHGIYLTFGYNLGGADDEEEEPAVPDYPTSGDTESDYEPEPIEPEPEPETEPAPGGPGDDGPGGGPDTMCRRDQRRGNDPDERRRKRRARR